MFIDMTFVIVINKLASLNTLKEKPSKHDYPIQKNETANNILIILESPHKDEYCEKCFTPLAPANGDTGINFLAYFANPCIHVVLDKLINDFGLILDDSKIYRICFVNPVPFQASLHLIFEQILNNFLKKKEGLTKEDIKNINKEIKLIKEYKKSFKNKVWRELFKRCKKYFIRRVRSYYPYIIINACTDELKKDVKLEIEDIKNKIICQNKFNTYHPSSWSEYLTDEKICSKW
jgi:hypothetical protein